MELSREAVAHCFEFVSEDNEPSTTCNGGLEEDPTTMVIDQPGAWTMVDKVPLLFVAARVEDVLTTR